MANVVERPLGMIVLSRKDGAGVGTRYIHKYMAPGTFSDKGFLKISRTIDGKRHHNPRCCASTVQRSVNFRVKLAWLSR